MAPLNPSIPLTGVNTANDPSYLSYSKPISEFSGNTSYESLFKGIGEFASSAIKGADFLVKESIDNTVYNAVDEERQGYTKALEKTNEASLGRPLNLLNPDERTASLPVKLKNLEGYLGNLRASQESGTHPDTYYTGRIAELAKNLRTQYPGYKEYIDSKFSSVFGTNPANKYVADLQQDLNKISQKQDAQTKFAQGLLKEGLDKGIPDADKMVQKFYRGETTPEELMLWMYPRLKEEADLKIKALRRAGQTADIEFNQKQASRDADDMITTSVANDFENTMKLGPAGEKLTDKQLVDRVIASQTGTGPRMSPQEAENLAGILAGRKEALAARLLRDYSIPDPDGTTPIKKMGGMKVFNEKLQESLRIYDTSINLVKSQEYGAAFFVARQSRAIKDSTEAAALTDPSIGPFLAQVSTLQRVAGTSAGSLMSRLLEQEKDLPNQIKGWANKVKLDMLGQPNPMQPTTFNQATDNARGLANRHGFAVAPVAESFLKQVDLITDPKQTDQLKLNVAKAFFDPQNYGVLSKYQRETSDPNGPKVVGRYYIYDRMTSKDMAKEIKRLDSIQPGIFKQYTDFVEQSFAQDLYSREIMDLRGIQTNPHVQITWNDATKKFKVNWTPPQAGTTAASGYIGGFSETAVRTAKDTVENRINRGITGLANVAEASGLDVEDFIVRTMMAHGFNPLIGRPINFSDALMKSLVSSKVDKEMKAKSGTK